MYTVICSASATRSLNKKYVLKFTDLFSTVGLIAWILFVGDKTSYDQSDVILTVIVAVVVAIVVVAVIAVVIIVVFIYRRLCRFLKLEDCNYFLLITRRLAADINRVSEKRTPCSMERFSMSLYTGFTEF